LPTPPTSAPTPPTPTATPEPTSAPSTGGFGGGPTIGPGGGSTGPVGGGGSTGTPSTGPGFVVGLGQDDPGKFTGGVDIDLAGFGGVIDWAVPALVLTVPGLLLILAVIGQGIAGFLWLPFVRRSLGGFGLRRRRNAAPSRPWPFAVEAPTAFRVTVSGMASNLARTGDPDSAGLCATCRHARVITSSRGSRFILCERSRFDPRYPRYPGLPVLACAGFEEAPLNDVPPNDVPPTGAGPTDAGGAPDALDASEREP
jgi:hypothetical protein